MVRITGFLLIVVLLASCSAQKLVEKGQVDAAFDKAAKQLERNPNRKTAVVASLGHAYSELQTRDYDKLNSFYASTNPNRWEYAVDLLRTLASREKRMNAIRLRSTRIVRTSIGTEPDYAVELTVAKREAAAHLLKRATDHMAYAREGDRFSARDAYADLQKRRNYAPDNSNVVRLRAEAKEIGTLKVGLRALGPVSTVNLENLANRAATRLSQPWVEVFPASLAESESTLDLLVELDVARPYVSPVQQDRTRDVYEKDISKQVSVGVDSSGATIYETQIERVKAVVITEAFRRTSSAEAVLAVIHPATGRLLKEVPFQGVNVWEDWDVVVRGDKRAIKGVCVPHLNSTVGVPPSRFGMANQALQALCAAAPNLDLDRLLGQDLLVRN